MAKLKIVAFEADSKFNTLLFSEKMDELRTHIMDMVSLAKKEDPSQTVIITMREYFLGKPITPEQNAVFKKAMSRLTMELPNLVIIGNTATVREYTVKPGINWVAKTADELRALDPEDVIDVIPDLQRIAAAYVDPYYTKHAAAETGDNNCIRANLNIVNNLQAALATTHLVAKVGIMKNNTYVFQGGGVQYHTKKAPINELSGLEYLDAGQFYFIPPITAALDLPALQSHIPALGGFDTMFMMNNQMYQWRNRDAAPVLIDPAMDQVAYDLLKARLEAVTANAKSMPEDIDLITRVTGQPVVARVQVFNPTSRQSQDTFQIQTPDMQHPPNNQPPIPPITLGIDTCREYALGTLKSANEGNPPVDIHLVLSYGMSFNGRGQDNPAATNAGKVFVLHDKDAFGVYDLDQNNPKTFGLTAQTLDISSNDLSRPMIPKVVVVDSLTMKLLWALDAGINKSLEVDPDQRASLQLIKAALPKLFQIVYSQDVDENARSKIAQEAYRKCSDILKQAPFTCKSREQPIDSVIVSLIDGLKKQISDNISVRAALSSSMRELFSPAPSTTTPAEGIMKRTTTTPARDN